MLLFLLGFASALTFQVEPKKTLVRERQRHWVLVFKSSFDAVHSQCLYEDLKVGQVTASWEVVRGGLLDVNIKVRVNS